MTNLISQLKLFEIVMLVCGAILFFVTVYLLIKRPQILLVFFFLTSVVMIGFPAIKSVKFSKELIEIVTRTDSVKINPSDTTAAKELQRSLEEIDPERVKKNPEALKKIANAQSVLGNYDTALSIIDRSIALNGNDADALKAKSSIEIRRNERMDFEKKIALLNQVVGNESVPSVENAQKVGKILSTIKPPIYVDKQSSLTLAKAFAAVDEREKALEAVKKITEAQPNNQAAITIQREIQQDTIRRFSPEVKDQLEMMLGNTAIMNVPDNKLIIKKETGLF